MQIQKYSVNQHLIESVLTWIKSGDIAIPEIQRPFVWDASDVRDLIDSLYQGYPIGYLIAWRNPDVKLKDGTTSNGKRILIDGQQRVMALKAAILGAPVLNDEYEHVRIRIAFNPQDEKFEVCNPAIQKDATWIPDISLIITEEERTSRVINNYCEKNPTANLEKIEDSLEQLKKIVGKQVGFIELSHELDIETVTEIFIRINSKGTPLSSADFAMSKIAVNEQYGGVYLRKCIDYFCHLEVSPAFFSHISEVDKEFSKTPYFQKIAWLKNEKDDIYTPNYVDVLRVAYTSEFGRGKLADLVSLLSGRNFETKTFEEEIAKDSFKRLEQGILNFVNETNFKRFVMIIRSAGFISSDLIRSQNAIDFAYILFLRLRMSGMPPAEIEKYVRRWFVLSVLTGRYSGSPESMFDYDIRQISTKKFDEFFGEMEKAELSEAFWGIQMDQNLETSVASSPYFNVFLAAQVKAGDKGFLSKDITVKDMIENRGDIHHIFPKDYLKEHKFKQSQYNQIGNYAYTQSEINIGIGKKSPQVYFGEILNQCKTRELKHGAIQDFEVLKENLNANCIPLSAQEGTIETYEEFLKQRRKLMAQKIKDYYYSL